MGKLIITLVWILAAGPLAAKAPPAAVTPAAAPAAAMTAPNSPPPSRYAGSDTPAYVANLSSQFASRNRVTDPFGQLQDPSAKPVVKTTVAKRAVRRFTAEPAKPLSSIVEQIGITTVMPKDKRFLVGNRSIAQGDKLTLNYRNKQIQTKIIEVSARRIVFSDLETGETAIRLLKILPPGMTPGASEVRAPGMTPADSNAPLEIGSP